MNRFVSFLGPTIVGALLLWGCESNFQQDEVFASASDHAYSCPDRQRKTGLCCDMLLCKAVASIKDTEASFSAGDKTFLDLIDSQRIVLEFELAYERALSNKAQRLAELEMPVGREIPRIENTAESENEPAYKAD